MNFSSVRWQDNIVANLRKNIKASTLSHAILFTGDKKTGGVLASATADAVLCDSLSGEACMHCPSCVKTIAGSHPDKITVMPQGSKATIGVADIRDAIDEMYIRPFIAKKKIFIFPEADKMTVQAQNALLKVLEAPPEYGIFILVSQKEEFLLETILSRLTKFKLNVPTAKQVEEYLVLKYPEKKSGAAFASKFLEGDPAAAEEYLLNPAQDSKRKRLLVLIEKLVSGPKSAAFDFAGYLNDSKDELEPNIEYIQILLRDIMYIKHNAKKEDIINSDLFSPLSKTAGLISAENILNLANTFSSAAEAKKKRLSVKLYLANGLLKVWEAINGRNSSSKI